MKNQRYTGTSSVIRDDGVHVVHDAHPASSRRPRCEIGKKLSQERVLESRRVRQKKEQQLRVVGQRTQIINSQHGGITSSRVH